MYIIKKLPSKTVIAVLLACVSCGMISSAFATCYKTYSTVNVELSGNASYYLHYEYVEQKASIALWRDKIRQKTFNINPKTLITAYNANTWKWQYIKAKDRCETLYIKCGSISCTEY